MQSIQPRILQASLIITVMALDVLSTTAAVASPATPARDDRTNRQSAADIIIDDQDTRRFERYYERLAGGPQDPDEVFSRVRDLDAVGGYAQWTNNEPHMGGFNPGWWHARWFPDVTEPDEYEVSVFIPSIPTGKSDTACAKYTIKHSSGETERVISQHGNHGRWISLGTYWFGDTLSDIESETMMVAEYVELDGRTCESQGGQTSVVYDAIRLRSTNQQPEPVIVNSYLRDLPDGAHVTQGDTVVYCFSVSRPVSIRWTAYTPSRGWYQLAAYDDDGQGECRESGSLSEVGERRVRIEALDGGRILASDEVVFYVDAPCTNDVGSVLPPVALTAAPGERFTWNFRIWNGGTCTWSRLEDYRLAHVSGAIGSNESHEVHVTVAPGSVWDVSISYSAPSSLGSYTTQWQMQQNGQRFGPTIGANIDVRDPATATPPPTPTPRPDVAVIIPGYGHSLPYTDWEAPFAYPSELLELERDVREAGIETIRCTYDWTNANQESAAYVKDCIRRNAPRDHDIHIITHSNGGLVARSMIQDDSYWRGRLGSMFMIAPPNQGVVRSYFMWAGGDLRAEGLLKRTTIRLMVALSPSGCTGTSGQYEESCGQAAARADVHSLGQLLPTGQGYIMRGNLTRPRSISRLHRDNQNDWLQSLNESAHDLFDSLDGVHVFIGRGKDTPEYIRTSTALRYPDPMWQDGVPHPDSPEFSLAGDGTVLQARAALPLDHPKYSETILTATHNEIIGDPTVLRLILNRIHDPGRDVHSVASAEVSSARLSMASQGDTAPLILAAWTDARVMMTDPRGRRIGQLPNGQTATAINGAALVQGQEKPVTYILVDRNGVIDGEYELQVYSQEASGGHVDFTAAILDGATGDLFRHARGRIPPAGSQTLSFNPTHPYRTFLPSTLRDYRQVARSATPRPRIPTPTGTPQLIVSTRTATPAPSASPTQLPSATAPPTKVAGESYYLRYSKAVDLPDTATTMLRSHVDDGLGWGALALDMPGDLSTLAIAGRFGIRPPSGGLPVGQDLRAVVIDSMSGTVLYDESDDSFAWPFSLTSDTSIALTKDSSMLAVGSDDRIGLVDLTTRRVEYIAEGELAPDGNTVAHSPTTNELVIAGNGKLIRWSIEGNRSIGRIAFGSRDSHDYGAAEGNLVLTDDGRFASFWTASRDETFFPGAYYRMMFDLDARSVVDERSVVWPDGDNDAELIDLTFVPDSHTAALLMRVPVTDELGEYHVLEIWYWDLGRRGDAIERVPLYGALSAIPRDELVESGSTALSIPTGLTGFDVGANRAFAVLGYDDRDNPVQLFNGRSGTLMDVVTAPHRADRSNGGGNALIRLSADSSTLVAVDTVGMYLWEVMPE